MATIGNITVPTIAASGTFPLVTDYEHGLSLGPAVSIHTFGSGNAKIEQRYYLGSGAKRYSVTFRKLNYADEQSLRDFWEARQGPYQPFTYNAPADSHSGSTTPVTVRFAQAPISFNHLVSAIQTGLELVEVPTSVPSYTVLTTLDRFPDATLETALEAQAQEVIPLVHIVVAESGYPEIFLSNRECVVGGQSYQARLLEFGGITQTTGEAADQATFSFGNADRVMRDLAADTNLQHADVSFSFYHVASQKKLDLWSGKLIDWDGAADTVFRIQASDPISRLGMDYPRRQISANCWKLFDDGAACPYTAQGSGGNPAKCDKGFATPNGCQAHGMDDYYGGMPISPQLIRIKDNSRGIWGFGRPTLTAASVMDDTAFGQVVPEIYTDIPMRVPGKIIAGRDNGDFYQAVAVVGEGPVTFGSGHKLDGLAHHGPGSLGLRTSVGNDPNTDPFGLQPDSPPNPEERAAGTAFIDLKITHPEGIQISEAAEHALEAVVSVGRKGFTWNSPGSRNSNVTLTNPIWVAINAYLRGRRLELESAAVQETSFDVAAAVAAAAACDTLVNKIIGAGTVKQFIFRGRLEARKPLRQWLTEILTNCLGYYSFRNGKLTIGQRLGTGAPEAFTAGNIVFNSLRVRDAQPRFNHLTVHFADGDSGWTAGAVEIYDEEVAIEAGIGAQPNFIKNALNLVGTATRDQAARIATTRLREEVGGAGPNATDERKAHRFIEFDTTLIAAAVEPGMVVGITHDDVPGGDVEIRVENVAFIDGGLMRISGTTVVDSMYDLTVGDLAVDVEAPALPTEVDPQLAPADVTSFAASEDPFIQVDGTVVSKVTVTYNEPSPANVFAGIELWGQDLDNALVDFSGVPTNEPRLITKIPLNAAPDAREFIVPTTQLSMRLFALSYTQTATNVLDVTSTPRTEVLLDGKQSPPTAPANPWCQHRPLGETLSWEKNPEDDLDKYLIWWTGDQVPYDLTPGVALKDNQIIREMSAAKITGRRAAFDWQQKIYDANIDGTKLLVSLVEAGAKEWQTDQLLVETSAAVFTGISLTIIYDDGTSEQRTALSNTERVITLTAAATNSGRVRFRLGGEYNEQHFYVAATDTSGNIGTAAAIPACTPFAPDGTTDVEPPILMDWIGSSLWTYWTAGFTGLTTIVSVDAAKSMKGVLGVLLRSYSKLETETDPDVAVMASIRGIFEVEIEVTYRRSGGSGTKVSSYVQPWAGEGFTHLDRDLGPGSDLGWVEISRHAIDIPGVEVVSARVRAQNSLGWGPWATLGAEYVRPGGGAVHTGDIGQIVAALTIPTSGTVQCDPSHGGLHKNDAALTGALTVQFPDGSTAARPEVDEAIVYDFIQGASPQVVTFDNNGASPGWTYMGNHGVPALANTRTVLEFRAVSATEFRLFRAQTFDA